MGSVYKRGNVWWCKFYHHGKPYYLSSRSQRKGDALRLLKQQEGDVAKGTFTSLQPDRTWFGDLAKDFLNDYRNNGRASLQSAETSVRRLKKRFGHWRAIHVTTDEIRSYVAERQQETTRFGKPPAKATINRELAALRRIFKLGKLAGKVVQIPFIPFFKEDNVRQGFFNDYVYLQLKKALPDRLKPILILAYHTGMRRGEILGLLWKQVDFLGEVIRLESGETKNKSARYLPIPRDGELYQALRSQRKLRDTKFPKCKHLFFYFKSERSATAGNPIKCFRASWATACKKIGLNKPGEAKALFHDLRRTGVRNLVRARVPEVVAMSVSGHKTRSVFDRYNIVHEDDIIDAGKLVDSYLEKTRQNTHAKVTELSQGRGQHGPQRGQFSYNRPQMHTNAAPRGQRRKTVSR